MSMTANLDIVAMALSGFSEDRNSMWRESCLKSRSLLPDPYLRATFAFLTADNDSYENVLVRKTNIQIWKNLDDKFIGRSRSLTRESFLQNESGMAVEDRVAFALMFLSDSKLHDYLKRLTQKLTEEGNLAGFLLTGVSRLVR